MTEKVFGTTDKTMSERYQAFIQNSSEGIWLFELDQPIPVTLSAKVQIRRMFKYAYLAEANNATAKMYGFISPKPMIGMRLGDFMLESDPENIQYLTAFVKNGYRLSEVDSHELDNDGQEKYFRNSLVGVVENNLLLRAWGTQQDVTDQRLAVERLEKSEERLTLALQASAMGLWEWDIVTGKLYWSPELKKLFGLKSNDVVTYDKYMSLVHPDDRLLAQETMNTAMKTGDNYRFEHRVVWPDGSVHWMVGKGKAYFKDGKPVRMVGSSTDINDLKRADELVLANSELKSRHAQLVALNDSKDEFISLASHQLRTPATGVKQYIGMLLEGYAGDLTEYQTKLLETAYESNQRQLTIVDDLLRVAHIDAGKVMLKKDKTNMAELIKDIVHEQQDTLQSRKQKVELHTFGKVLAASVDRDRLRMVFENLIDNASKYSPKDSVIKINLSSDDNYLSVKIIDRGVGIAKKDIHKLFQKFSRVSNPLSTLVGGTGIGLYWAKKIVDLHGGTITVSSRLHKGTIFTVLLPI